MKKSTKIIFFITLIILNNGCQKKSFSDIEKKIHETNNKMIILLDRQNNEISNIQVQIKELQNLNNEFLIYEDKLISLENRINNLESKKNSKKTKVSDLVEMVVKNSKTSLYESAKNKFNTLNMELTALRKDLKSIKNKMKKNDSTESLYKGIGFPFKFISHNGFYQFDHDKEFFKIVGRITNLSDKPIKQMEIKGAIYGQRDEVIEEISLTPEMFPEKILPKRTIRFDLTFSRAPAHPDKYKVWVDKYKY